jgi:hypothetical protein
MMTWSNLMRCIVLSMRLTLREPRGVPERDVLSGLNDSAKDSASVHLYSRHEE